MREFLVALNASFTSIIEKGLQYSVLESLLGSTLFNKLTSLFHKILISYFEIILLYVRTGTTQPRSYSYPFFKSRIKNGRATSNGMQIDR